MHNGSGKIRLRPRRRIRCPSFWWMTTTVSARLAKSDGKKNVVSEVDDRGHLSPLALRIALFSTGAHGLCGGLILPVARTAMWLDVVECCATAPTMRAVVVLTRLRAAHRQPPVAERQKSATIMLSKTADGLTSSMRCWPRGDDLPRHPEKPHERGRRAEWDDHPARL